MRSRKQDRRGKPSGRRKPLNSEAPPPGGPANLYGILYQILNTLRQAIDLRINGANDDFTTVQLVLEPKGGDLNVRWPFKRHVQQFKARSGGGTWPLNEVINDVLPDLYLAIDSIADDAKYEFVTEGRVGMWADALTFFGELSKHQVPTTPAASLDDVVQVQFFPAHSLTKRQLFLSIVDRIRQRCGIAGEDELAIQRKLWHLLSRFEFRGPLDMRATREDLLERLSHFVPYEEDVPGKLRELEGLLLELSSRGAFPITARDLLAKANLTGIPVSNLAVMAEANRHVLLSDLRHLGYLHELDVRDSPEWPPGSPMLCLSGESGQGKTWQLARLADHLSRGGQLTAFIRSSHDVDADIRAIGRKISNELLRYDQPLPIERLASKIKELALDLPSPWLIGFVDDVLTVAHARSLAIQPWEKWGIRLALTVPPTVARALKNQFPAMATLATNDFSLPELNQLLTFYGRVWQSIPPDVRDTLRRPLLAHVYVGVSADPNWQPTSEYELYAKYWGRLTEARDQADHPGDRTLMMRLARNFLQITEPYPWPNEILRRNGLDDTAQRRLESIGWLRRDEKNSASVWHDRLLNWAIAEALVDQFSMRELSLERLSTEVVRLTQATAPSVKRSLRYVPMDVLWIATRTTGLSLDETTQLLFALESREAFGYASTDFYEELIPGLGFEVVPALVERIRRSDPQRYVPVGTIARSILRIHQLTRRIDSHFVENLLNDSDSNVQDLGVRLISKFASPRVLDRLWEIHTQRHSLPEPEKYSSTERTSAALKAVIRHDPSWLRMKIAEADSGSESVRWLAYLLADLESPDAVKIWRDVKAALLQKIPKNSPRSLITCIQNFRDSEEVEWLESWLQVGDDFADIAAFAALAVVAPERALVHLGHLPLRHIAFTRSWWLPRLLLIESTRTHNILRIRAGQSIEDARQVAQIYSGYGHGLDLETLKVFVATLETMTASYLTEHDLTKPSPARAVLSFVASVNEPDLLRYFRSLSGTSLERTLTDLAKLWAGVRTGGLDDELEDVIRILEKIGCDNVREFLIHLFSTTDLEHLYDEINLALRCPSDDIRAELQRIVDRTLQLPDTDQRVWAGWRAVRSLAALGDDQSIIKFVLARGDIDAAVPHLIKDLSPMTDEILRPVLDALSSGTDEEKARAITVLGLSRRGDLMPLVITELQRAPRGGKIEKNALIALRVLIAFSSELPSLGNLEESRDIELHADILFRSDREEALNDLQQYLESFAPQAAAEVHLRIAVAFLRLRRRQETAARFIWSVVKLWDPGVLRHLYSSYMTAIGYHDDPQVRELLLNEAYLEANDMAVRVNAIRGLSVLRPEEAFGAALNALRNRGRGRDALPDLIMRIDPSLAIEVFCSHLPEEVNTLTRLAICRALRIESQRPLVESQIAAMINDGAATVRRAAADIAGWLSPETKRSELRRLALEDLNADVRDAAFVALHRQRKESISRRLLAELNAATGIDAWNYVDALLENTDPVLLEDPADPLSMDVALKGKPAALTIYAWDQRDTREERFRREIESADSSRRIA